MRTIGWLKKELEKFPDDAVCCVYEREDAGLAIEKIEVGVRRFGFIYCSGYEDYDKDTELLTPLLK